MSIEASPKLQSLNNAGIGIVTFSLEDEINPGLRNKIRRAIQRYGLAVVGTTLFEGNITPNALNDLVEEVLDTVKSDLSGASLTNLEVWFMGTQRYSFGPNDIAAA